MTKSRILYKNKNTITRKQRGAGGCWGGLCSGNKSTVNATAHVPTVSSNPPITMVENPMFTVVKNPLETNVPVASVRPSAPTPKNREKHMRYLTWLWGTARDRFTKEYPRSILNYQHTQKEAMKYFNGNRDPNIKFRYNDVIFALKSYYSSDPTKYAFLDKARNNIDSLSQNERDVLNNMIIIDYTIAEIRTIKKEFLDDYKGIYYTYNEAINNPVNKLYKEDIRQLFEELVENNATKLLTYLERERLRLIHSNIDLNTLVNITLSKIKNPINKPFNISTLSTLKGTFRGGRVRDGRVRNKKYSRKMKKNKQKGSGGCFGWMCSKNNTGVNNIAHQNPLSQELQINTYRDELIKLAEVNLEEYDLESKENEGTLNLIEEKRLKELKLTKAARKIQYDELMLKIDEIIHSIDETGKALRLGILNTP